MRMPCPFGPLIDVAEAVGGELGELVAGAPRPYEVAVALLGELRGRSPTVLVLENAHWADEATLDVLSLLAARVDSVPALVLVSYRAEEVDRSEQLRFVLGELVRRPGRLKLEPLSIAAVSELAAWPPPQAPRTYPSCCQLRRRFRADTQPISRRCAINPRRRSTEDTCGEGRSGDCPTAPLEHHSRWLPNRQPDCAD